MVYMSKNLRQSYTLLPKKSMIFDLSTLLYDSHKTLLQPAGIKKVGRLKEKAQHTATPACNEKYNYFFIAHAPNKRRFVFLMRADARRR